MREAEKNGGGREKVVPSRVMDKKTMLHMTSGDVCGGKLRESGIEGEVFVWHDVLYDGPRNPGWPTEETLEGRARFLEGVTGGGLRRDAILATLREQYRVLEGAKEYDRVVLWFDACLFDLAMLCHILACGAERGVERLELVYVDAYPGIEPFHGLGQLSPETFLHLQGGRRPVTKEQLALARAVDRAFALQDRKAFLNLAALSDAPIPGVPAALRRWLEEEPDPETGLGKLERLALEAVRQGCRTPKEVFGYAARHDTPPQFWGDAMLWGKINGLARRSPPLLAIEGPAPFLPQWNGEEELDLFLIYPV